MHSQRRSRTTRILSRCSRCTTITFAYVTLCRPRQSASTTTWPAFIRIHLALLDGTDFLTAVTMEGCGALRDCRYLLHDRDTKYTQSFRVIIASGQVEPLVLPARSPNLNAHAERWVRSVKEECLCKVILFGERSLRRALNE